MLAEVPEDGNCGQDGQRLGARRSQSVIDEVEVDDGDVSKRGRVCPVPKPGGLIGQIMGFREEKKNLPISVEVQPLGAKSWKKVERVEEG